jgi:acyl dehydratase
MRAPSACSRSYRSSPNAVRMAATTRSWRSRVVTARDIELFTEISGDRNPLHYDAGLAARSRFGGLVVQGAG